MDFLWDKITEWLKEMLVGGIVSNLSGMFDATNQKVAEISGQVGLSPQAWNGSIFSIGCGCKCVKRDVFSKSCGNRITGKRR